MHNFDEWIFKLCKLEFWIACYLYILIGIWHIIRYFFYIFPAIYELERPAWWTYFGSELTFAAANILQNVLMLGNPFPVRSLCKLKHISVFFIQISTNITCKQLIPLEKATFFWGFQTIFQFLITMFKVTLIAYKWCEKCTSS